MATSRFPPDYLDFLMQKFAEDSKLGVAGTPFTEDGGYDTAKDSFEGENYVAGGCQLFRRACFEEIGGYVPNAAGGLDWIAVTTARMKGWKVRSFPEKRFHHYRTLGTAQRNQLSALFSYGERAYYLGWSPIWQFVRCIYRMIRKPIVVGGMALLLGYCLGGNKTDSASRLARRRPLSSTRTNGEIAGNSGASITLQEDRQFSCRTPFRCGARASPKRICPLRI